MAGYTHPTLIAIYGPDLGAWLMAQLYGPNGVDPSKANLTHRVYPINFANSGSTNITNGSSPADVTFSPKTDCLIYKMVAIGRNSAGTPISLDNWDGKVTFEDRVLVDQQPISGFCGSGQEPFILGHPILLRKQSQIVFNLTNQTGSTFTVGAPALIYIGLVALAKVE